MNYEADSRRICSETAVPLRAMMDRVTKSPFILSGNRRGKGRLDRANVANASRFILRGPKLRVTCLNHHKIDAPIHSASFWGGVVRDGPVFAVP